MIDLIELHEWACEWQKVMNDGKTNYQTLLDKQLTQSCTELGFDSKHGQKIIERFALNTFDDDALFESLNRIENSQDLGSAFLAHWLGCRQHFLRTKLLPIERGHRYWFRLVLSRLIFLSEQYPTDFSGDFKTLRLVNIQTYLRKNAPDTVTEQHLTLAIDGRFWAWALVRNSFNGKLIGKVEKKDSRRGHIARDNAWALMNVLINSLYEKSDDEEEKNRANWQVELTNQSDKIFLYNNALSLQTKCTAMALTRRFRQELQLPDYLFFDEERPEVVERITCRFIATIKESGEGDEKIITQYASENLDIDRYTGIIEHSLEINSIGVEQRFKFKEDIGLLLDSFDGRDFFKTFYESDAATASDEDDSTGAYHITVEVSGHTPRMISGKFNRAELPKDWLNFSKRVEHFLKKGIDTTFYNSRFLNRTSGVQDELIICSVKISGGKKLYDYLTTDESIGEGDLVMVPVGPGNHLVVGQVENLYYCLEENVPYPLEKMKQVVRLATAEDLKRGEN